MRGGAGEASGAPRARRAVAAARVRVTRAGATAAAGGLPPRGDAHAVRCCTRRRLPNRRAAYAQPPQPPRRHHHTPPPQRSYARVGDDSTWSAWHAGLPAATRALTLRGLAPLTPFAFRLVVSNGAGESDPGEATSAALGGVGADALERLSVPLEATAHSSASIGLLWRAATELVTCQSNAAITLQVQRRPALAWHDVRGGLRPADFHPHALLLHPFRCPPAGCSFRLQLPAVASALPTPPSTLLRTLPLPALPPAAVRLELEVAGAAEEWGSAPDAHEVSTRTRALPLSSL